VPRLDVVTTSSLSLPVVEVAHGIRHAFQPGGAQAEIVEDILPPATPDGVAVIVAPHEALSLFDMERHELARRLARTVLISTARPSSIGWRRALPFAHLAGAVLDISDAGVTAYASAGIQARRFRLGYDPAIDLSTGGIETRPLDVTFLGTSTPRRQRVVAAAARHLSRRDIDLRFTEGLSPLGRLYHDRHGLEVICLRIGGVRDDDDPTAMGAGQPFSPLPELTAEEARHRWRSVWLSHRDCAQLIERALTAPVDWAVVYGTSNNPRRLWDLEGARDALGFEPQDAAPT